MKRGIARALLLAGLVMSAGHLPAEAQQMTLQRIAFLPIVSDESIRDTAEAFQNILISGMRLPAGKALLEQSQIDGLTENRSVRQILSSTNEMERTASDAGAAYLIGGVLTQSDDGGYEFHLVIFDEDTRQIASVHNYSFVNAEALFNGAGEITAELARARNYTSADSAFFLSILIPGVGQLQKEEPIHALVSAGLMGFSILYAISTPKPDPFEFSREGLETPFNWATGEYDHTIGGIAVTAEVFYQVVDENWEHHLRARAERRAVKIRRKRASGLVAAAYLFNVVDSLLLARERPDSSPFFLSLEGVSGQSGRSGSAGLSMQLRISFR